MVFLAIMAAAVVAPLPVKSSRWITQDDYPNLAYYQMRSGFSGYALSISPDGRPLRCEIIETSGSSDLDERTCELMMKRGRFDPARDGTGAPIVGVYRGVNRWHVAEFGRSPTPPRLADIELTIGRMPDGIAAPATIDVAFLVSADGTMSNCASAGDTSARLKTDKLGAVACKQALGLIKRPPAKDASGRLVPSVQTAKVLFRTAP